MYCIHMGHFVFTLDDNCLLKWQVTKYVIMPSSKFLQVASRLYVSLSIVLMSAGHVLGGDGTLMTYIWSTWGHLLLGKLSCLLALKM